ncbi:MAG TPA: hypothetical protein VNO19_07680 [Gemmatimonadales bacterium]|nr:hypothetical protein [Gemmatimonadales bacterium]
MSGHVFHPGHAELHGITVVVETSGSLTYVGRYDSEDERGVLMLDVGVHDATAADVPKDEYVRKSAKFGIRSDHKRLVVPAAEVTRITRLGEMG